MLERLDQQPPDALLALIKLHDADPRPDKIDLGVGVYRTADGATPVFATIKAAETRLVREQDSKAYLGPEGDMGFVHALMPHIFGADPGRGGRIDGMQTPGGTGAVRLALALAKRSGVGRVLMGTPSWPNHAQIVADLGMELVGFNHAAGDGSADLDALIAHRTQALAAYQSARYARRYARMVQVVRDRETAVFGHAGKLTRTAAEGLYRVMAYKDEYEVARLHAEATYGEKPAFHMSPPLIARIDKATDDELWHRFSSARSTYTRRRKAQFAEQANKRDGAASTKRAIINEAQKLATSTDWGPTSGEFRDLMQRWKAAGPAPRDVDDKLWQEFRGLQDTFFAARTAAQNEQDQEFVANQQAKEALLAEYEPRIKPNEDLAAARTTFRELLDKWSEIGKVPRDAMRPLDGRIRSLESSLKKVEDDQWKRTNPEARARAEDTASKLRDQISSYEEKAAKAEARGDAKAAAEARKAADTYRTWLSSAEAAANDFSG